MTQTVVIVQRVLTHYRVPLFEQLRGLLEAEGVELRLVVGQPAKWEASKNDAGEISWAQRVHNRYFRIGKRHLVWQPVWRFTRGADLVVVEQASRLLMNYPLLLCRGVGSPKVAFWGHGRNMNPATRSGPGEALKRRLLAKSDWWFAYTAGTAEILKGAGVGSRQITVLQNAIDTKLLAEQLAAVSADQVAALREQLGIGISAKVGLVLGSVYAEKRPDFVVESADLIREAVPDFHLIVIGDGPLRSVFDVAASKRPWIHVVGSKNGPALAGYAAISSVMLNPGVVGLAVLDAFALGLPMLTCQLSNHGPEFSYLLDGCNGLVARDAAIPAEFATQTIRLLSDGELLVKLQRGCASAAMEFTIGGMAENFAAGIVAAIDSAEFEGN